MRGLTDMKTEKRGQLLYILAALALVFIGCRTRVYAANNKYIFMGDSYTCTRSGTTYDNVTEISIKPWPQYVKELLNLTDAKTYGYSGHGFIRPGYQFITRLKNLTADPEVTRFILSGGIGNDYNTSGHGTRQQIEAAIAEVDSEIRKKFPNALIMYSVPNWGISAARQQMILERAPWYIGKAKKLGWRYLENTETILRVSNPKTLILTDGIHPNQKGMEVLGKAMARAISRVCPETAGSSGGTPVRYQILLPRMGRVTTNSIQLYWNKIDKAYKYEIYGNLLTLNYKKVGTVMAPSVSSLRTNLKSGACYKFVICALDSNNKQIARSRELQIVTPKSKKYTNCTSVAFSSHTITLSEGQRKSVSATEKFADSSKVPYPSSNGKILYVSNTPGIAEFISDKVFAARAKGTCKIYAVGRSGVYDVCTVTVK